MLLVATLLLLASCKKFVDVDIAPGLLTNTEAYSSDASATSAILSLYSYYPSIYCISNFSYLGGVYADELQYTGQTADIMQFAQSNVSSTNSAVSSYLWSYPYQVISQTNQAISGISSSSAISAAAKSQLLGEARFFRAFMFFNLVNYLGGVPLTLGSNQLENARLARSAPAEVYAQIIADLKEAETSLPASYAGVAAAKARVNKWAAAALLARVYLYQKDYVNAEAQASLVINSGAYSLDDLSNVFLNTSKETILQFSTLYGYSTFGTNYRSSSSSATVAPPAYVLYTGFIQSFERGDQRRNSWVDSTVYNQATYYRINKYKLNIATAGNEYNVVLRLAEQYLIRSEARAALNNISGAQSDLNIVRSRAGLSGTAASGGEELLDAVLRERKVELFGEYSQRWFDLKRTGRADAVIGALKSAWKPAAVWLPIPNNEIILNPNLTQNPGY